MKLLLFDIDGTLLHTDGAGRAAVARALSEVCGAPVSTDGVRFSGKTDPQIMRQILEASEVPEADAEALLPRVLEAYAAAVEEALRPDHVTVLPGVKSLLDELAGAPNAQLALLTGNLERTATLKLRAAGLDGYFPFGAFGSDHADRYALPAVAVQRAEAHTGRAFEGRDVVIIGDTEHDILCGQSLGVFSVAVCTGRYARADLSCHAPDLLLDNLTDGALFFERVVHHPAA